MAGEHRAEVAAPIRRGHSIDARDNLPLLLTSDCMNVQMLRNGHGINGEWRLQLVKFRSHDVARVKFLSKRHTAAQNKPNNS